MIQLFKYVALIVILSINLISYSQEVYFGYTNSNTLLKSGDRLIINLPEHQDGRFVNIQDFDNLIKLMESNQGLKFKVELNWFYAQDSDNLMYTQSLSKSLSKIIAYKSNLQNYEIEPNGSNTPIFLNKESVIYKEINTRIEIVVI